MTVTESASKLYGVGSHEAHTHTPKKFAHLPLWYLVMQIVLVLFAQIFMYLPNTMQVCGISFVVLPLLNNVSAVLMWNNFLLKHVLCTILVDLDTVSIKTCLRSNCQPQNLNFPHVLCKEI